MQKNFWEKNCPFLGIYIKLKIMKHILNNISDQEKNSIREQHTGGMKVMTEDFSRLLKSKLGDSKPLVSEQMDMMDVSSDSDYYQGRKREVSIPFDDLAMLGMFATQFCREKENLPDCKDVRRLVSRYNLFM
jgi:hypothetical protein